MKQQNDRIKKEREGKLRAEDRIKDLYRTFKQQPNKS